MNNSTQNAPTREERKAEINANYQAFKQTLPNILIAYRGKVVLLKNREAKGYFSTMGEAIRAGKERFPDKLFSVQPVEPEMAVDLGWYSHVQ
jgi:hypothetical protein